MLLPLSPCFQVGRQLLQPPSAQLAHGHHLLPGEWGGQRAGVEAWTDGGQRAGVEAWTETGKPGRVKLSPLLPAGVPLALLV